jgi:hypothetical protein
MAKLKIKTNYTEDSFEFSIPNDLKIPVEGPFVKIIDLAGNIHWFHADRILSMEATEGSIIIDSKKDN